MLDTLTHSQTHPPDPPLQWPEVLFALPLECLAALHPIGEGGGLEFAEQGRIAICRMTVVL